MRSARTARARAVVYAFGAVLAAMGLGRSALAIEFTTNTTITSSQYNGEPIIVTGCTLTIDCSGGVGSYASLLVRSNGVVTHPAGSANGLWLQFTGDVTIEAGSRIDADARGFGSQGGPGGGASGAGGSHGGTGGYGGKAVYDSITAPSELGSGGGNTAAGVGGAGGGLIRITTPGVMTVNGEVRAEGQGMSNRGGGSGGAIFLDVGTITGGGVLSVRGGSCTGTTYTYGGGGGGRMSILYTMDTYTGQVYFGGGTGRNGSEANDGGPGTLYYKGSSEPYGFLWFDNGTVSGWTVHPSFDMSNTNVGINNAKVSFDCGSGPLRVHDFTLGSNSAVSHPAASVQGLDIRAGGDVVVDASAQINVDGKGFGAQGGPGGGASGAGGSHGGTGGYGGAAVYDDVTAPSQLGSGGGNTPSGAGGEGGGLIRLEVTGSLTLNGEIRAGGLQYSNCGGGSGGAVYILTGAFAGTGPISANGGSAGGGVSRMWGGGGGGRVAIHYDTSSYTGAVTAKGAVGRYDDEVCSGGPGTVYTKGSTDPIGTLVFDGGGIQGWTVHPAPDMSTTDITVKAGLVSFDCSLGPLRAGDFVAGPGSTVSHPAASPLGLAIQAARDVLVDSGGKLMVDGRGYPEQSGPGGGGNGAGGSHGGTGGYNGAPVYDSVTAPSELGSGGGNTPAGVGMPGGGRISITAIGTVTVDGSIEANGAGATNRGSGSGGSIFISTGTFAGAGSISAVGGTNSGVSYNHGGGGGGRVAVLYNNTSFTGSITARGGLGRNSLESQNGGAGTIYLKGSADPTSTLVFDNGGIAGWTVHPSLDIPEANLTVANALLSVDCALQPMKVNSLTIGPSATVTHPAGSEAGLNIESATDVNVLGSGQINTDGCGYGSQAGPGGGANGAGGSHGGTGGYGGVAVNDDIASPVLLGSGGGATPDGGGAPGGGRVTISSSGALTIDGAITANGLGYANRGCGAGGTLMLTAGALAGSGVLSAQGGTDTAASRAHGGGGGGRIALRYDADLFTGTVTAAGGRGRSDLEPNNGGPGTIYRRMPTRSGVDVLESVLFDNGSVMGWTNHPAFDMPGAALITHNARVRFDCAARAVHVRSLDAQSGSILTQLPGYETGLAFLVETDANVASGATLDVSTLGYPSQSGPGGGASRAGGSYGGRGGRGGVDPYGMPELPAFLGSGGGGSPAGEGGSGAGILTLLAAGTVTVDGHLLANGQDMENRGAGSGGSIRVAALSLVGSGIIAANGGTSTGSSYSSGGGGGGRVGLYVQPGQASFPAGTVTAAGGTGVGGNGTDGTVYRGDTYTLPDLSFLAAYSEFHWNLDGNGVANLTVVNWGIADATSVHVELFSGDPGNPGSVSLGYTTIASLPKLTSTRIAIDVAPQTLTEIWAVLDPGDEISEGNETNNTLVFSVVRTPSKTLASDRTATITEAVTLRGYCYRAADNTPLTGKTLEFRVDGVFLGTAVTASDGRADYNWVVAAGPASRPINVRFNGDVEYTPSAGNATLTCQSWTTKMATFNRTARITDRTELKCRLLRSDNVPLYNKNVRFYVDGTFIISRPTNTDGYASYPYYDVPDGVGAGTRTILSEWVGNAGYAAVSKTATLTVLKALPYIWVLPKSVPQGAIANLYAYFRRLYDYQKQEGKPVTFRIDGTWIADVVTGTTASGEPGVARYLYNTSGLSKSVHTVRCEFAGDAWLEAGYGEGNLTIY